MTFEVSSNLNYSVIPWNNPAKNPALNSCNGECWKIKGDVLFQVKKGTLIKRHKRLESVPFTWSNTYIERCCAGEPGSSLVTWNSSKKAERQSYVRLWKYASACLKWKSPKATSLMAHTLNLSTISFTVIFSMILSQYTSSTCCPPFRLPTDISLW